MTFRRLMVSAALSALCVCVSVPFAPPAPAWADDKDVKKEERKTEPEAKKDEPAGEAGVPITPDEAAGKVGKKATVRFAVRNAGGPKGGKLFFLNSEKNYKSEKNFTVVLESEAIKKFGEAGVKAIDKEFIGKIVLVTGMITLHDKKPQLKVFDPAAIKVEGDAPKDPDEKTEKPEKSEKPEKTEKPDEKKERDGK